MKRLCEFTNFIDYGKLKEQYNIRDYELANLSVGYDDVIYLLLAGNIPERISGMFVPTKSNTDYKCIIVAADWENNELLGSELYNLGVQETNIHFIQPIGNEILLLGARAYHYRDGRTDKNAIIVDKYGNIIKKFCLGDGIEDCIVTSDKRIITSYFDEGIFGNYGWDTPLGQSGLVVWNESGGKIWENTKYDICDCYALNIDESNNLWFYYYTDFNLIKTDFHNDQIFDIDIDGSSAFLINKKQTELIFDDGYKSHKQFTGYHLKHNKIIGKFSFEILYHKSQLLLQRYTFRSSKAVFIDDNDRMFCRDFS
ncbi:hypothetical protein [Anaerocolumna xylanovorans]|uniref:Uncharacterized protein n=1 Tax=Anaerocolumna xylanovorans DSM 12503 TaxID=1121345 RepID=A0A1M7YIQ9_9FIRM|nr:hypothetical protein [Anaerocolumna xylanovorans]SHO52524.1 hypothetical protein SAMN02745217_03698 [Anaerocolumna xylanovorans DSM 12503]